MTVNTLGRLTSEEQFGRLVVKSALTAKVTRLRDVARVRWAQMPCRCAVY